MEWWGGWMPENARFHAIGRCFKNEAKAHYMDLCRIERREWPLDRVLDCIDVDSGAAVRVPLYGPEVMVMTFQTTHGGGSVWLSTCIEERH